MDSRSTVLVSLKPRMVYRGDCVDRRGLECNERFTTKITTIIIIEVKLRFEMVPSFSRNR